MEGLSRASSSPPGGMAVAFRCHCNNLPHSTIAFVCTITPMQRGPRQLATPSCGDRGPPRTGVETHALDFARPGPTRPLPGELARRYPVPPSADSEAQPARHRDTRPKGPGVELPTSSEHPRDPSSRRDRFAAAGVPGPGHMHMEAWKSLHVPHFKQGGN